MQVLFKKILVFLYLCFLPFLVSSQVVHSFKSTLDSVEQVYGITFSYDTELIEGVEINTACGGSTLESFFRCISDQSILKFELASDHNYVIIPSVTQQAVDLKVEDGEGTSLYGVQVFRNGKLISTSDYDGNIHIPSDYSFNDTISFQSFGLMKQVHLMKNLLGQFQQSIVMQFDVFELDEVVIESYTAEGVNMLSNEHGLEIDVNELSLLPGETDGDIFMSLQTIPGITTVDGKAGNLYIRGGTPDQNLVLFDHIPIYHTGHYFGTISPYNPDVVDKMDVYRTGFSTRFGGRLSSAIDIKSRTVVSDSIYGSAAINTLYASGNIIVPIGKKVTLQVAGRSSYPSDWVSPKLEEINDMLFKNTKVGIANDEPTITRTAYDFHFHDFNAKLIADVSTKDKLLVSFMNIDNELEFQLKDDLFSKNDITGSDFLNNGISLQWNREMSERFLLKTVITGSDYQYNFHNNSYAQKDNALHYKYTGQNKIIDYGLKVQGEFKVKNNVLESGIEVKNTGVSYNTRSQFLGVDSSFFNADDASFIHSVFLNYDIRKKKLNLNLGARASYYGLTKEVFVEPRVFANYKLNKNVTLKGSTGIYAQYLSYINNINFSYGTVSGNIWKLADGTEAQIAKSWQSMLGVSFSKNGFVFDLEVYNKEQRNQTYYNNDFTTEGDFYHKMAGRTYGFDVLVKKKWKKLSSWVGYTYNKSTYWLTNSDSLDVSPSSTYFDQPHTINIVGLYEIGAFRISLGWTVKTGLITGYRSTPGGQLFLRRPPQNPTPGQTPTNAGTVSEVTEGRFPTQHQLDLSTSWKYVPKNKKFTGHIGLSILNVYNQANIIGQISRPVPQGLLFFNSYSLGFSPNLQFSVDF